MNETMLKDLGSKSTPDCVLLDDCYINGQLVRWIDMKNFYGSCQSIHFVDKLKKQVRTGQLQIDYLLLSLLPPTSFDYHHLFNIAFPPTLILRRCDMTPISTAREPSYTS